MLIALLKIINLQKKNIGGIFDNRTYFPKTH